MLFEFAIGNKIKLENRFWKNLNRFQDEIRKFLNIVFDQFYSKMM